MLCPVNLLAFLKLIRLTDINSIILFQDCLSCMKIGGTLLLRGTLSSVFGICRVCSLSVCVIISLGFMHDSEFDFLVGTVALRAFFFRFLYSTGVNPSSAESDSSRRVSMSTSVSVSLSSLRAARLAGFEGVMNCAEGADCFEWNCAEGTGRTEDAWDADGFGNAD